MPEKINLREEYAGIISDIQEWPNRTQQSWQLHRHLISLLMVKINRGLDRAGLALAEFL